MNSSVTVQSELTWAGPAEFRALLLPPEDLRELLIDAPKQGFQVGFTVDIARFKYKKQIGEQICDGNLNGTIQVNGYEVEWVWDPVCRLDGKPVDLEDIVDEINIEEMAGEMLDGAESGVLAVPVVYDISLDIAARSGMLAMGSVTVESMDLLDVYLECDFAADGSDVIFNEDLELTEPVKAAVKKEIISIVSRS